MSFILKGLDPNNLRASLLLVSPNETTFPTMDQVPNYVDRSMTWFLLLIILELACMDKKKWALNDSLTSLNASILNLLFK